MNNIRKNIISHSIPKINFISLPVKGDENNKDYNNLCIKKIMEKMDEIENHLDKFNLGNDEIDEQLAKILPLSMRLLNSKLDKSVVSQLFNILEKIIIATNNLINI